MIFGGGAFTSCFFLGVMRQLQHRFSPAELERWAFCGESAGCVYALAMALGVPVDEVTTLLCRMSDVARSRTFGIVGNAKSLCEPIFRQLVCGRQPEAEAVRRLRGRFAVTFNAISLNGSCEAYRVDEFQNFNEIWEAVFASGSIPFLSEFSLDIPRVGGRLAVDAVFSSAGRVPILPWCALALRVCAGQCHPATTDRHDPSLRLAQPDDCVHDRVRRHTRERVALARRHHRHPAVRVCPHSAHVPHADGRGHQVDGCSWLGAVEGVLRGGRVAPTARACSETAGPRRALAIAQTPRKEASRPDRGHACTRSRHRLWCAHSGSRASCSGGRRYGRRLGRRASGAARSGPSWGLGGVAIASFRDAPLG